MADVAGDRQSNLAERSRWKRPRGNDGWSLRRLHRCIR